MALADTIDVALRAEISQYASSMAEADKLTARAVSSIDQKFKRLGSSIAALTGGLTIAAVMQQSVRAFSEAEQAGIRLDSVLNSMGRGTGALSLEMKKLAGQIQAEGIIPDDEIVRGQAMLATFDTISNETLPRATRVMADFATRTGDTHTAAVLLGRASAGMTETLARYGVVLPDAVKKSGDFNLILTEIEKKIGGMNRALGDSASGQLKKFANAWDDVLESIGGVLTFGISGLVASTGDIQRWGDAVVTVLDFIGDELDLLSRLFMTVGETLGAGAAQAAAVAQLEFDQAASIGQDWQKRLDEIWDPKKFSDRRKKYMDEVNKGAQLKDRPDDFKLRNIKAEEEAINARKRAQEFENEVFDDYLKNLDEYNTKQREAINTLEDAADPTREMQREMKKLNELWDDGRVSFEAWANRMFELDDQVKESIKDMTNTAAQSSDEMSKFFERAMENMQDAFASMLEDIFMGKAVDFEKQFKQLLARMAAQLAASKILEFLFGTANQNGQRSGGVANAAASGISSWITSLFKPSAMGGSVSAGEPLMVGERGRELFVPKTDGMVVNHEQLSSRSSMAPITVTNVFNISTGVSQTVRAEMEQYAPIIEERSKQGVLAAIERGGQYAKAVNRRS